MPAGNIEVRPVTAADWDDVVTVFGTRGDAARCWCQWFRVTPAQWRQTRTAANREALRREVTGGADETPGTEALATEPSGGAVAPPPGVLAWLDGEPAGWCAVGPRSGYPRLTTSRAVRGLGRPDDPGYWSVTCFVVRVGFRRRGLAAALLGGAVDLARAGGARTVEAYPVDVAAKPTVTSSELYHGPLSVFLAAGFTQVLRTSAARPVVRLELGPGGP